MNSRLRTAVLLLLASSGCAGTYLLSLHPLTGRLGGLLFFLLGWALPTLALATLALALAWTIGGPIVLRVLVATILSFPLGINTDIPSVEAAFRYQPSFDRP